MMAELWSGHLHVPSQLRREDGSVVTWGDPSCGGDSSAVSSRSIWRVDASDFERYFES